MKLQKIKKNLKLIKNIKNNELNLLLYKSLYNNLNLSFFFRKNIYYKYINCNLNHLTRLKLNCIITSKSRSKYSFFNISRIKIRDFMAYRLLTGVRKSSW